MKTALGRLRSRTNLRLLKDLVPTVAFLLLLLSLSSLATADSPLRLATFHVDATPPLGSPLCNGAVKPAMEIVTPLTARGVVLLGADEPIVLCAIDWVGIGNGSYDAFREALAESVGTSADRVALHTLHQHDAPGSDFAAERLLAEHGLSGRFSNPDFDARVMQRLAAAAKQSLVDARPVTHVGLGAGKVERVASNRRILGPDGRVAIQRQSSGGRNRAAAAAPEGTVDPLVRLVAFWHGDQPLAVLTYYATHPQSYYGRGGVNWDFVGIARAIREEALPGVPHIHFDGAGGNVAAGKYNDGSPENRPALAKRLAAGIELAWSTQQKQAISANDVHWSVKPVTLPVRGTLDEQPLLATLKAESQQLKVRIRAARDLTFLRRMRAGHQIPLSCLSLGTARVLHMPGELFVEYQLAAQQMRPDSFVAMAAYGDYGPGYIGTEIAYSQGGYETGVVSRVAPAVEHVLIAAMTELLAESAAVELPQKENLHLFLLVGQSNMAGRGKVAAQDKMPHQRVVMLDEQGQWVPAADPIHFDKPVAGVGLGKTFGMQIAESNPEITVGLIPCAVGGSPIDSWKPNAYYPPTDSHPWDDAIRRAKRAQKDGVLKGILWHQGESDSKPELAAGYEAKLHDLIERLRAELNAPKVPFIAGQMGRFPDQPWDEARKTVDQAHRDLPSEVEYTAFVNSEGLQHKGDKVHFDAASYRELGKRYAAAYLELVSDNH